MSDSLPSAAATPNPRLIRARAKLLAREDRAMRAELIRLRREAGLTQKMVAEMLGISQQAIHKFERYDSDPKLSTLRRYANVVGAVVEHQVIPDVGQSEWIAPQSEWEAVSEVSDARLRAPIAAIAARNDGWTGSKRADFALAG